MKNKLVKLYSIHAITDEVYAVIASKPREELTGERGYDTDLLPRHMDYRLHAWRDRGTRSAYRRADPQFPRYDLAFLLSLKAEALPGQPGGSDFACGAHGVALLPVSSSIYLLAALSVLTLTLLIASAKPACNHASDTETRTTDGMP